MGSKFERFTSEGKGNGLRAVVKIKCGELIYTGEPYAFCISKDFLKSTCQNCLTRAETLLRCSQCKIARYCNAQCQKQAWSEHKKECKCLTRLQPKIPADSVRLVARIVFKLLSGTGRDPEEPYSLAEHQSHLADMSEQKKEGLGHLCSMLRLYLREEECDLSQLPSGLDPINLLARVTCNCFTISDGELQDLGVGLYPSMSLLNHDCQPNCVMVFEGKRLQLRAVRDIQPQEELTISYTDVLAPSTERRRQLQEQYHFFCQCQRCTRADKDSDMLAGETEAWQTIRDAIPHLERLQADQQWEELLTQCQVLLDNHGGVVPDRNIYLLRVLDMALDACISLDQYDKALEYGYRTQGPYELYFSDPHPSRAVELFRVGKLQHFLCRLEEAHCSFRQAYDIMKVTHGSEHALTNQLRRKLEECQAELGRL
ncbi:histone-lysine N-methyltransferase SMYD3 [Chanos chanos]|uniref:[histone H3]-lysine(4) N-trimethyltransferase n=1 Tax=Chanos chanos TaxID=29144 RepID=A0A6J2WGV5_CHACN|nr:histone-lysine N-methyltransferase SMYD3 [Chanos chanos]